MEIRRYESDLLYSNMYVIVDGDHAIVIDPLQSTVSAEGLIIDKIILTHEHYDHISGVNLWKTITNATVLCSKACAENIQSSRKNLARYFREFCKIQTWIELEEIPVSDLDYSCRADETFENKMNFIWRGHEWQLIEIPGHSMGSIGILLDKQYFFSGDSLMENSEIELRMPGGSRKKWREIGEARIKQISNGILVYPGHFKEFEYQRKGGN